MNWLTNILLTVILASIIVGSLLLVRFVTSLLAEAGRFLSPGDDGQPSPLAKAMDAFAVMVARALAAQFKTITMGELSGDVRAQKAIQGDLALDVAGQSPALAALLGSFPNLRKTLRRNPGLLDLAMPMLGSLLSRGGTGGGTGGNGSAPKFKL